MFPCSRRSGLSSVGEKLPLSSFALDGRKVANIALAPRKKAKVVGEGTLKDVPSTLGKRRYGQTKRSKCSDSPPDDHNPAPPDSTTASYGQPSIGRLLDANFFDCDALELAPKLLGKLIRRDDVILRITEVEAYRPNDSACHGRFGQTARTNVMFGPAGRAYVYLCYGLHVMLNIVADNAGVGAAVLIRSCSPVAGVDTVQRRRGQVTDKPVLLNGPGKVGQALGLSTEWSNHPVHCPGGLEILDAAQPASILVGPRVGIDYASAEDVAALWRFAIAGTPWISSPRSTLKPPR